VPFRSFGGRVPVALAALPDSPQPCAMSGGYNFHCVYMALEVLLVECKQCNRRAALGKDQGLADLAGEYDAGQEQEAQVPMRLHRRAQVHSHHTRPGRVLPGW